MNKFVKGAFIFTGGVAGGFVLCGVTTINIVLKSETFRKVIKEKISDEVMTFLYGEKPKRVSYSDVYKHRTRRPKTISYADIIFETREDAVQIQYHLNDLFDDYGSFSVADFYELCGVPVNFTDNNLGWNDPNAIKQMNINKVEFGYQIYLPKPVDLV